MNKDLVYPILATFAVVFLSIIVGELSEKFNLRDVLIGILIMSFVVFSTIYIVIQVFSTRIADHLSEVEISITELRALSNSDWLVSSQRLMEIEATIGVKEMWIVTKSLDEEISDELYLPIIKKNLASGKNYIYFIPDDRVAKIKACQLLAECRGEGKIEVRVLDESFFRLSFFQDLAIYGGATRELNKLQAFMNLPIQEGGYDYFIRLGSRFSEQLVASLTEANYSILECE